MSSFLGAACPREKTFVEARLRRPHPEPIKSSRRDKVVFISYLLNFTRTRRMFFRRARPGAPGPRGRA